MDGVQALEKEPEIDEPVTLKGETVDEAIEEARKEGGPFARHCIMTAARAKDLFENRNTHNRPFTLGWAEMLRDEIVAGRFRTNGEAIKIDRNGVLLDGQHRLWAIWQAGISFKILVVTGLDPEVFSTLDQGKKRSGGDVLAVRGVKRHALVSGAASMLYRLMKDREIGKGSAIPAYGIEKIWERHPAIVDAVEKCVPVYARGGEPVIGLPYLAAYRYLLDPVMAATEQAETLIEGMVVGANLDEDDPVFRFRQRVMDTRRRSAQMGGAAKLALLTKVVGMHLKGEKVGRSLQQPDASTEKFSSLVPGMAEALAALSPAERLDDLDY